MHNDAKHFVNQLPKIAINAIEDISNLAEVFSWLDELFASIEDASDNKVTAPGVALIRIKRLASLGRNVSANWADTAESMAGSFAEARDA